MSAVSDRPSDSSTAFAPSASCRMRWTVAPQWTGNGPRRQPAAHVLRGGRVEHAREHLPLALDHGQLPFALEHRVEHDEADEARADQHHARRASRRLQRRGVLQHALRVGQRPQRLDTGQIGAGDRRGEGRRAGGDQQLVEIELAAVGERHGLAARIDGGDANAEPGRDLKPREVGGVPGVRMRLGDGSRQPVRQRHPRMRRLVAQQRDGRLAAVELPDRLDRVGRGRSAANDDVMHGLGPEKLACARVWGWIAPGQADARPSSASFSRVGTPSSDQPRSR